MTQECQSVRAQLEPHLDGDLDDSAEAAIRSHVESCADCRAEYALAAALPTRLHALASPSPPPELLTGVMEAVGRQPTSPAIAWGLLAVEAALVATILAYVSGLDGLARLANNTAGDVSQLVLWGVGSAEPPPPAFTDLFLTTAAILLVAVSGLHIVLLGRPARRRRAV